MKAWHNVCVFDCFWLSTMGYRLFSTSRFGTSVFLNLLFASKCELPKFAPIATTKSNFCFINETATQANCLCTVDWHQISSPKFIKFPHFHIETEIHLANLRWTNENSLIKIYRKKPQTEYRFCLIFLFFVRLAFHFILHPFFFFLFLLNHSFYW